MTLLGSGLTIPKTRFVYFSFHYERDIHRVNVVKNHGMTKGYETKGYFDGSLEEKAKKESIMAVKRAINGGLKNTSVTCVLIGNQTFQRAWVDYEVFKSVERGNGVFGVRIHNIQNLQKQTDTIGNDPFLYQGFSWTGSNFAPKVKIEGEWKDFERADRFSSTEAAYLNQGDHPVFSSLFKVYDWTADDGYKNFSKWVAAAAKQAGR